MRVRTCESAAFPKLTSTREDSRAGYANKDSDVSDDELPLDPFLFDNIFESLRLD